MWVGKFFLLFCALLGISFAKHKQFPNGFEFGVATLSYDIGRTWNMDHKLPNVWDIFTNSFIPHHYEPGDKEMPDASYAKVSTDIRLLKELGVNFYKFSISWASVLPTGFANVTNSTGVKYYHYLIDNLLENNITPMVTMFHGELPKPFEERLIGLMHPEFVDYFKEYAHFLFNEYGKKVKYWITLNEPLSICGVGYGSALASPELNQSGFADYLCGRHLLLAHSEAYHVYYKHFADQQQGKVGIALNANWMEPNSTKPEDLLAAERAMEFQLGWFAHPIFTDEGDYPEMMKKNIKHLSELQGFDRSRLPAFSVEEVNRLKYNGDFFALNHFSTLMVADPIQAPSLRYSADYLTDTNVTIWKNRNWPVSNVPWIQVVPWGFRKLLNWIHKHYKYPLLYVTENGYADNGTLDDDDRISYHSQYLENLLDAIYEDGVKVSGYGIWNLLDSAEWWGRGGALGPAFGLYRVNFDERSRARNGDRTPKKSVTFFQEVFSQKRLP